MEIKLKENSTLTIKNHNGTTLCSVDEATGAIDGAGTKLYEHTLQINEGLEVISLIFTTLDSEEITMSNYSLKLGLGSYIASRVINFMFFIGQNGYRRKLICFNATSLSYDTLEIIYTGGYQLNTIQSVTLPINSIRDTVRLL